MYAVVQIGAVQVKVAEGDTVDVARIKEEVGQSVTLDKVLLYTKGMDIRIGQPYVNDVTVTAKVVRHGMEDKVVAFKYRKRTNSASKRASRRPKTALSITKISAS